MKDRWENPPEKPKVGVEDTEIILQNDEGDRFRFDRMNLASLSMQLKSLADANSNDEKITDLEEASQ